MDDDVDVVVVVAAVDIVAAVVKLLLFLVAGTVGSDENIEWSCCVRLLEVL